MTGTINGIHSDEPVGTVEVHIRLGPNGKLAARNVTVSLMWPPVEREESYKRDCGCREVYAVSDGDYARSVFGFRKADEQRFICACYFVEVANDETQGD